MKLRSLIISTRKFDRSKRSASSNASPIRKVSFRSRLDKGKATFSATVLSSSGSSYATLIQFQKTAKPLTEKIKGPMLRIRDSKSNKYVTIPRPDYTETVKVRCNCADYKFTFWKANEANDVHFGKGFPEVRVKGTGVPRNPEKFAGACKHIQLLVRVLAKNGKISKP